MAMIYNVSSRWPAGRAMGEQIAPAAPALYKAAQLGEEGGNGGSGEHDRVLLPYCSAT